MDVGHVQVQEAKLFGCQGVGIKKPDPYDIFKADVCSGEQINTTIKEICDKFGASHPYMQIDVPIMIRSYLQESLDQQKVFPILLH